MVLGKVLWRAGVTRSYAAPGDTTWIGSHFHKFPHIIASIHSFIPCSFFKGISNKYQKHKKSPKKMMIFRWELLRLRCIKFKSFCCAHHYYTCSIWWMFKCVPREMILICFHMNNRTS